MMAKGPVLFDLNEDTPLPSVADAPVPEDGPQGAAMQTAARVATRRPSRLARWFWGLLASVIMAFLSVAAWDIVIGLVTRNTYLGYAVATLVAAFLLVALVIVLRELAALSRLARLDKLRHAAATAREQSDLRQARDVATHVLSLYATRPETDWGRARATELQRDQVDAAGLLDLVSHEVLGPLARAAEAEIAAAARQVATVTALVPLALADVAAALTANLRMIRRIAEIYGGRSGLIGGWRLTRAVLAHLVATGAIAAGDDLLEPVLGGTFLAKLSRRFGEGLVNGALTARVGVAALEVCRPIPFVPGELPRARDLVRRALVGFVVGPAGS